jgi:hypothetical protein
MDHPSIRDKARRVVITGKLPTRPPDRVWGGRGEGAECSICDIPVQRDDVELELEFIRAGEITTHHLHVDCFTAWERERDDFNFPAQDGLQRSA